MSTTPQKAAIYCRISKDNGSRLGVQRQQELCEKLAGEKGWKVGAVYVDNDISAYSGTTRPEYERMLSDLDAGIADGVLVVDQDRLTRHPMELETFIIAADKAGVPIANVAGEIDLSTSDGRFRARIMGAVARQESEKKSERIKRQKDQAAAHGWAQGGIRRYGYRNARTDDDKATLEVVASEADIVREIAARVLVGETLQGIARDLNERHVPTVTGSTWRVTTLKTLLTGPHLTGLRVHRGEIVGDGNWPPILDRGTWEQIRAILGDPRRIRGGRPATRLLTGLLRCSKCGATLYHSTRTEPKAGPNTRRYSCSPSPGTSACGRTAIAALQAEEIVASLVYDALDSPEMRSALDEAADTDVSGIVRSLETAEASLDELARHYYTDHHITEREFLAARSALESQMTELRGKLGTQSVRPGRSHADLKALWADADTVARRLIITEIVDHVVVKPGVQGRRQVDPERLEIHWKV